MANITDLKIGCKIRTINGTETVIAISGCRIYTDKTGSFSWYHPSKVNRLYWSNTLKKFVTIPE